MYLRELPPFDRPEIARREVQEKRAQAKAETIIAYLNQEHNGSLRGLAGVPLLLQIMAMLWKEREYLPGSRLELYDAALNYLLDYRDRRRGIDPLLAAKDARRVLSPVSLWMQDKLGKDEVDRDAMHTEMQHVLDTLSRTISASEFCRNLVDRAGLLVEYGEKEYVFRHKTFREYLAGVQLVKNVHRTNGFLDDLVKHFGDDWWLEPLRFFIAQLEDADLFDLFMQKLFDSPVTEYMTPKQQNLLLTLIREAPQKKIDAIKKALFDPKTSNNRKSYLAECLKAMGRYDASVAVRRFELKYVESKIYRNIYEYNTPYILIEGGIFTYSLSNKSAAIGDFYMAKYPVTNRCYCQFMDYLMTGKFNGVDAISLEAFFGVLHRVGVIKNFLSGANALKSRVDNLVLLFESQFYDDKRFNGDDHPVVGISWYAAKAYCIWLSLMESGGDNPYRYRLPSEIEWEYAAAGKDGRTYPWGYAAPNQTLANYNQNEGTTTPVGSYPEGATPQGINDMAGNVWEWMDNWYDNDKDGRALRGGSWYFHHDLLRSSSRDGSYPDGRYYDFGFRVMRNAYSI